MLKQWLHQVRGHATTRIPVTVFTRATRRSRTGIRIPARSCGRGSPTRTTRSRARTGP